MHLVAWKSDELEVIDFFNKLPILLVKAIFSLKMTREIEKSKIQHKLPCWTQIFMQKRKKIKALEKYLIIDKNEPDHTAVDGKKIFFFDIYICIYFIFIHCFLWFGSSICLTFPINDVNFHKFIYLYQNNVYVYK